MSLVVKYSAYLRTDKGQIWPGQKPKKNSLKMHKVMSGYICAITNQQHFYSRADVEYKRNSCMHTDVLCAL